MRSPSMGQLASVLITLAYRSIFGPANLSNRRRRVAEAKNLNRLHDTDTIIFRLAVLSNYTPSTTDNTCFRSGIHARGGKKGWNYE